MARDTSHVQGTDSSAPLTSAQSDCPATTAGHPDPPSSPSTSTDTQFPPGLSSEFSPGLTLGHSSDMFLEYGPDVSLEYTPPVRSLEYDPPMSPISAAISGFYSHVNVNLVRSDGAAANVEVARGENGVASGDQDISSCYKRITSGDKEIAGGDRRVASGDRGVASGDSWITSGDSGITLSLIHI